MDKPVKRMDSNRRKLFVDRWIVDDFPS